MRAAIARSSTEPMEVCSIARPDAQPGQVLVRIEASGVNPLDTKIYAGAAAHARQPLPAILGLDLAGGSSGG
jgi:NADPH:quinone reductase